MNLNLKGTERMDYIFNIQSFGQLYDIAKERKGAEFEAKFEKGEFSGCPRETGGALTPTAANLDLSAFSCPEELVSLGLDRLKCFLMALRLKCGGTLVDGL